MTDRQQALELLNATHTFPTSVMLKIIGRNENRFTQQVVDAVQVCLGLEAAPPHRTREAAGGRHVAVTLEPWFECAEQVLDAYARVREIKEVVLLL
jgi:putative lipoic acid-binding regulatory protein